MLIQTVKIQMITKKISPKMIRIKNIPNLPDSITFVKGRKKLLSATNKVETAIIIETTPKSKIFPAYPSLYKTNIKDVKIIKVPASGCNSTNIEGIPIISNIRELF